MLFSQRMRIYMALQAIRERLMHRLFMWFAMASFARRDSLMLGLVTIGTQQIVMSGSVLGQILGCLGVTAGTV